jgi:hypothetical protein
LSAKDGASAVGTGDEKMGFSDRRDPIVYGSAFALMATGIAVIVIGTWAVTPEGDEPGNEPATARSGPFAEAGNGLRAFHYPSNIVSLPVFSADDRWVGDVVKVSVTAEGEVNYLYVEMPEFLGLGSKIVRVPSTMIDRKDDRVELVLNADAVNRLAEAE